MLTAGAAQAKEFGIAVGEGAGGTQEALGNAFIAALEEQTGGTHSAKLFLNGQLGSEQDTVNEAAIGTLDFSILAINNVTPFSPTVGTLTLPYMILSLDSGPGRTGAGREHHPRRRRADHRLGLFGLPRPDQLEKAGHHGRRSLRSGHDRVTFQFRFLSPQKIKYVEAFADLFWIFFNAYFIWLAYDFVFNRMNKFWKSQTLGIEMKYVYLVLPIAFTLMTIRILQVNYRKLIRGEQIADPDQIDLDDFKAGPCSDKDA